MSKEYNEYLKSECWKCTPQPPLSPSPTGAHHWIEVKADGVAPGTFVCRYCWENRRFPLALYGELKNGKEEQHGY